MVDVLRPRRLDEALSWLGDRKALPLAGGTDFMVHYRNYTGTDSRIDRPVLFTDAIEELREIEDTGDALKIGAACLLSEIEENQDVPAVIRLAVSEIAAPALRNRATMAGNICNASPAGDTLPPLFIYEARLVLASSRGSRVIDIGDFIIGPGQTALSGDELLTHIIVPKRKDDFSYYRKVGTRAANALSKLSVTALAGTEGGRIRDFRMALGAVAPTVVRIRDLELLIEGKKIDQIDIDQICQSYSPSIRPIDDQRSTARYRKEVALNLIGDVFVKLRESI